MRKISRVLVLGSTGLVGHGISKYLIKKKINVYGTSNKKKVKTTNKRFKLFQNIDLKKIDSYNKIEKIIKKNNIQAVINSAALIPNKPNYNKKNFYLDSISINFLSFLYLVNVLKKNNVSYLINISTHNVDTRIDFQDLKNHHNFYLYTKYLAELYLLKMSNLKIKITSLRIKSPYGYILNTKAVVSNFINRARNGKRLALKGNINKKQSFTFVEDIGASCEKIFKQNLSGIFDCIGNDEISVKNLAKLINSIFKKHQTIKIDKSFNSINKNKLKKNINSLSTPLKVGLFKIFKSENNLEIFK